MPPFCPPRRSLPHVQPLAVWSPEAQPEQANRAAGVDMATADAPVARETEPAGGAPLHDVQRPDPREHYTCHHRSAGCRWFPGCSSWGSTGGQAYFAPRGLTYLGHLVVLWLVVTQLGQGFVGPLGRVALRVGSLVVRRPQRTALPVGHRWMRRWVAIGAVFLIDAAMVASHQLTPYMLVLQVAGLTMFGLVRPRLLAVGLLVVAVAYLVPTSTTSSPNSGSSAALTLLATFSARRDATSRLCRGRS